MSLFLLFSESTHDDRTSALLHLLLAVLMHLMLLYQNIDAAAAADSKRSTGDIVAGDKAIATMNIWSWPHNE